MKKIEAAKRNVKETDADPYALPTRAQLAKAERERLKRNAEYALERAEAEAQPLDVDADEFTELGCALLVAARKLRIESVKLREEVDPGCTGPGEAGNHSLFSRADGSDKYAEVLMREHRRMQWRRFLARQHEVRS
jgi:hypothetical protein